VDFFLNFFDKKFGRLKTSRIFVPELKTIVMSDNKTIETNQELVMEYSPILGVSYGLKTVENLESETNEEDLEKKD
jgi:hypothetical protein